MEPTLNSKRVCELLGISRATLSRMVRAGEIPYILRRQGKRKRMVMFNEALLERWLTSRTRVAAGMRVPSLRRQAPNGINTPT
jgi:excisionase family DNA binding protein